MRIRLSLNELLGFKLLSGSCTKIRFGTINIVYRLDIIATSAIYSQWGDVNAAIDGRGEC